MTSELQTTLSVWIAALFAFGATIFFVLLAIERPVWSIARGRGPDGLPRHHAGAIDTDGAVEVDANVLRRVHATLQSLIPVLPPANGTVVLGGTALLTWQALLRDWDWQSVLILGWYAVILLWTIFGLRIAASVRDVLTTPSDAPLPDVARGVARLIRAHRDGLINTFGPLALQLGLIVHG